MQLSLSPNTVVILRGTGDGYMWAYSDSMDALAATLTAFGYRHTNSEGWVRGKDYSSINPNRDDDVTAAGIRYRVLLHPNR